MINIVEKAMCCGCGSCVNICPKQCISMKKDKYGFLYPQVDIDNCIECALCERVCPEINKPEISDDDPISGYIVRTKDERVLMKSTSGGFFYGLCQYVCSKKGVVYGVLIDDKMNVLHDRAETISDCEKFLGSKYVQSDINTVYKNIKKELDEGRLVCFSGTPCQVQGLYFFLNMKSYDNLILVDIVCHGVVSEDIWHSYLEYEHVKYKASVSEVQFRSKKYGYQNSAMRIRIGAKEIYGTSRTNAYLRCFYSNIALRDSCYKCPAKTLKRVSDFTIFDSWNAHIVLGKKDDDKGYTSVIIQSSKGTEIIEKLSPYLELHEVTLKRIIPRSGGMILKSSSANLHRNTFLNEVSTNGFESAFNHYLYIKKKDYAIEKIKFIMSNYSLFRRISKFKREAFRKP